MSWSEARKQLEQLGADAGQLIGSEFVPLEQSIGRYVAEDIYARDFNPRFDNSAVDGYAVVSAATRSATPDAPVSLTVRGCLAAGERPSISALTSGVGFAPGECVEIMTGAKLPRDGLGSEVFDAVIKCEETADTVLPNGELRIKLVRPVKRGENIRYTGEDFQQGDRLFSRGMRLEAQHVLALIAAGHVVIAVQRQLRAVIITTGDEISPAESLELGESDVRNSTALFLALAFRQYGVEAECLGIVSDEHVSIKQAFVEASELRPDIIVTTGGVSAGKYDLVPDVLNSLGAELCFHRVAVRPGKPVLLSRLPYTRRPGEAAMVFGLPGNPGSVAAGMRFFLKTYLQAIHGAPREEGHILPLTAPCKKPAGLTFFQRGVRDGQGVKVLAGQASFMVRSFIDAEGWIVGDPAVSELRAGELIEWYPVW